MRETIPETVGEAGSLLVDVLATVVLTVAGVGAELQSVQVLDSNAAMALWFGYMGAVSLYAGLVVIGGGRLLPRLRGAA